MLSEDTHAAGPQAALEEGPSWCRTPLSLEQIIAYCDVTRTIMAMAFRQSAYQLRGSELFKQTPGEKL